MNAPELLSLSRYSYFQTNTELAPSESGGQRAFCCDTNTFQTRIPQNLLYQASFPFPPRARLLHFNNNRSITSSKWQIFELLKVIPHTLNKNYKFGFYVYSSNKTQVNLMSSSSRWPNYSFVPRSLKVFPPDEDRMRSSFLLPRRGHHLVVLVQNFCW